MNETLMFALGYTGAFSAIAFAGIGSALGTGAAGSAAVGAWKKCYAQNKPAPFQLLILAGAPLSQTIYGMVVMFLALGSFVQASQWPFYLMLGIFGGLAMGASAWMQGKAGAGACDAFAETEKGFTNYLMALGIIETVAIFIMAFAIVIMAMTSSFTLPFDVTIADQAAVSENALISKIAEPVTADSELVIASVSDKDININVYPCDKEGNVSSDSPVAITLLMKKGTNKTTLSSTTAKEKKLLTPGDYIMNITVQEKSARIFFTVKEGVSEKKQ